MFSACKGKDIVAPFDANPPQVITVNTTTDTINIYQNNVRQNNTSSIYPGGATAYLPFLRGTQDFQIRRTGTTDVLFTKAISIDTTAYYTFFVAGTTADKFFMTTDNLAAIYNTIANGGFNNSAIRFVNASYNSGPLNVSVSTDDTLNVTSLKFGNTTPFVKFNPTRAQDVKIYLSSNTAKPLLDTTIQFLTGVIYTIYTKGTPATGTSLSTFDIGITTNQYLLPVQ